MGTTTALTIEQFDRLPITEGVLYELNEGEIVTVTEARPRHKWVRDNITRLMGSFGEERIRHEHEMLQGTDLLPGFSLDLKSEF